MIIRPANPLDIEPIAALHAASWRLAYRGILADAFLDGDLLADRRRLWQSRFDAAKENQTIVVAEDVYGMLGFACAYGAEDSQWGTLLENLHVTPERKGMGIGTQMLAHIARWSLQQHGPISLHLWVLQANTAAQAFYRKLGAREVERSIWDAPDQHQVPEFRYAWEPLQAIPALLTQLAPVQADGANCASSS